MTDNIIQLRKFHFDNENKDYLCLEHVLCRCNSIFKLLFCLCIFTKKIINNKFELIFNVGFRPNFKRKTFLFIKLQLYSAGERNKSCIIKVAKTWWKLGVQMTTEYMVHTMIFI